MQACIKKQEILKSKIYFSNINKENNGNSKWNNISRLQNIYKKDYTKIIKSLININIVIKLGDWTYLNRGDFQEEQIVDMVLLTSVKVLKYQYLRKILEMK